MILRDLLEKLHAIAAEYGDHIVVMHHDDWSEFEVDAVTYEPEYHENPKLGEWDDPPHVLIRGDSVIFDGKGGLENIRTRVTT